MKIRMTPTTAIAVFVIGFGAPAWAATTGAITKSQFNGLNGQTSKSITVTGVTDGYVTADLTFTFSTNVGTLYESERLGIDSNGTYDQGSSGDSHINQGETLSIDVAASNVTVAADPEDRRTVTALNFGISAADMVRANPTNGSIRYIWDSSAGSHTSSFSNKNGGQNDEVLDGSSLFDILAATYQATFNVDTNGDTNATGLRFVTDAANFDFNFAADISYNNTLARYDFQVGGSGQNFNQAGNDSSFTADHTTATRLTTNGLDGGGAGNIFNSSGKATTDSGAPMTNWGNGDDATPTNYAEFTVTPDEDYATTYESLSLYHKSFNGTGEFALSYIIGSGSEVFIATDISHAGAGDGDDPLYYTLDFTDFSSTQTVTWRLYAYGATGENNDADTGHRFDDIMLYGSTFMVPEPAALPGGLALLALAVIQCRRMGRRSSHA